MRGRVGKRGKSWFYVVDVGRDETGKRRQQWQGGFPTRKAAEAGLSEVMERVRQQTYVSPSKETVGEFLAEWVTSIQATVRRSTSQSYAMNMLKHVTPALGQTHLQALTPAALNSLYADLLTILSPRTVRYVHTILHRALKDAVRWQKVPRNVADLASPPSVRMTKAPEMKTWTREDLRAFLEAVRHERLYPAWLLACTTGMRRGELLGLRWSDIDLQASRISIRQSLVLVGGSLEFSEPKTRQSRRSLALDSQTAAALRDWRKHQLEERIRWGKAYEDSGLVFTRENGSPINPHSLSTAFSRHITAAGLPRIRVHDLRHTYATLALQAGVHPKVVSERLGHSSIAITMDTYSHAIPALQEEAAEKVAGLIFGLL